jgi:hypothetical protein
MAGIGGAALTRAALAATNNPTTIGTTGSGLSAGKVSVPTGVTQCQANDQGNQNNQGDC